jgi:hypothetical protein
MIVIPVRVCGDAWSNRDEVQNLLKNSNPRQVIYLDFFLEGISVTAIGLGQILEQHCCESGRNPDTIKLINFPNHAESTGYANLTNPRNHCYDLVKGFWQAASDIDSVAKSFGYFIGRKTIARSYILFDLYHNFKDKFLFSAMNNAGPGPWISPPEGINLEKVSDWMNQSQFEKFCSWFDSCPVRSIDNHRSGDQYDPKQTTHKDLLQHYDRFQIELVAETYTIGNTFFATEKTYRPIMATKPILVYGPRHFLSRLQDKGFETWSSCWDESYDLLEGPERWQAIRALLPNIKYTDRCQEIAVRNCEHLRKLVYDNRLV